MPIEIRQQTKEEKQANGVDDGLDELRDPGISNRPDGLPLPNNLFDGPVLQDWWCQFWEIWHGQRGRSNRNGTMQYITGQRNLQKSRNNLMQMDPGMGMRQGYMMGGMNNGMGGGDMRKVAMAGNNQQRNLYCSQHLSEMVV